MNSKHSIVGIARGADHYATAVRAISEAGGVDGLVKRGSTVFIKPNIVGPSTVGGGRVTDWRVIQAIVDECRKAGAGRVIIGESPVELTYDQVIEMTGYRNITGAELFNTDVPKAECMAVIPKPSLSGQPFYLPKIYLEADVLIDAPILKTHSATGVTLGMKGLGIGIPPLQIYRQGEVKLKLHNMGLNRIIPDVCAVRRPDLVVIDGMMGGEGFGPAKPTPIKTEIVIAGRDIVAVDATGVRTMGFDPHEVTHIVYGAGVSGLGYMDDDDIEIRGESLDSVKKEFLRPPSDAYPFKATTVIRRFVSPLPLTIDGLLDGWKGAWWTPLTRLDRGYMAMLHDWQNLYLALVGLGELEKLKALDIFLSFNMPFEENMGGLRPARHTKDDPWLRITLEEGCYGVTHGGTGQLLEWAEVAADVTNQGSTVEVKIPLTSLGQANFRAYEEIWVDVGINGSLWSGSPHLGWDTAPGSAGRAMIVP